MKKDLTGTLIFDNGGGLTLQLNNTYAHWYQNMNQAAEDLKAYIKDKNTEYWDGNEEESMELNLNMTKFKMVVIEFILWKILFS